MSGATAPWSEVDVRLRPFVARRVSPPDVDDVMQDVYLRLQRGLGALRDEQRMGAWLHQVARSAIADHGRARARHPLTAAAREGAAAHARALDGAAVVDSHDDREVARALASCVAVFVARLPSPYREAVTLVELEGLTAREAAAMTGVSLSGMKSRVQRGRAQLRALFEDCCAIALDARGKVTGFAPRSPCADRGGC